MTSPQNRPPIVSSSPTAPSGGVSRRQVMNMMTAVSVVPAIGIPVGAVALAIDRADWDAALARYHVACKAHDAAIDRHSNAVEAAENDCPHDPLWFDDKYKLRTGMSRDEAAHFIALELVRDEMKKRRELPRRDEAAARAACRALNAEARRLADEFMAYNARIADAERRHHVADFEAEEETAATNWKAAHIELMAIPAPDVPAFLMKLETAIHFGGHRDKLGVLDDARRLLTVAH